MAFEPGDVVILKSGGHSMTVVAASEDEITCLWINEAGQLFRETIPAIALEPIYGSGLDDDEVEDEEEHDEDDDEDDEEEEEEKEEVETRKKRR